MEWLADVPTHWEVRRLRAVARIVNGATPSTNMSAYWDGDVIWLTPEDLGRLSTRYVERGARQITLKGYDSCGTNLAPAGSLAISTRAPIGHLGVLQSAACVNQGCRLLVPNEAIQSDYLYYALKTSREDLEALGQGSTFMELSQGKLGGFAIPLPPFAEQAAIVRYLDHADWRIRRYINAKERLIGLLEEQRQAVIHRAVTRGLDPDVRLKPSGVEWLGDVPAHWEVRRVKQTFRRIVGGSTPSSNGVGYYNGDIVWVTPTDISKVTRLRDSQRRLTIKGFDSCFAELVPVGSLVVTSRAPVGNVALAEVPLCTNQGCKVLIPEKRVIDSTYGYHVFSILQDELQHLANGTTFTEISTSDLGNILLPLPPLAEQAAIVEYLDKATADIDAAIARTRRHVELLCEYRTRLIADVVTGKLDVCEAAATLSENTDESNKLGETDECSELERAYDHAD